MVQGQLALLVALLVLALLVKKLSAKKQFSQKTAILDVMIFGA